MLHLLKSWADLEAAAQSGPDREKSKSLAKGLHEDILTTLNQAYDSGWQRTIDLSEPRYASLKKNERFATKIAELNERATHPSKGISTGGTAPTGTSN